MSTAGAVLSREDILEAAGRIDPLPSSVTRLLELSSDPEATLTEVASVIRYDPVLTVDLLRRVNSAMSSARYNITDINDAVARIGTSEVLIMAMQRAMHGRMSSPIPAYGLDGNSLWRHSLASAVTTEVIIHQSPTRIPAIASTAALLHDVGKLVLAETLAPNVMQFLMTTAQSTGRPLFDVEREVLGADHAEIGATVLRSWGFPLAVQIAVTRHHDADVGNDVLTHTVAAANAIAHSLPEHCGLGEPKLLTNRAVQSLQAAGIRARRLPIIMDMVEERFLEVMSSYSS